MNEEARSVRWCPNCRTCALQRVSFTEWSCPDCQIKFILQQTPIAVSSSTDELSQAKEDYRLANQRIIELLDTKIALTRERDELAAALDAAREILFRAQELVGDVSNMFWQGINKLADPAAILAERDRALLERCVAVVDDYFCADYGTGKKAAADIRALAAAPEAKP
jgi:hypothetical protein